MTLPIFIFALVGTPKIAVVIPALISKVGLVLPLMLTVLSPSDSVKVSAIKLDVSAPVIVISPGIVTCPPARICKDAPV